MPELHRLFPDMPTPLDLPAHLQQRYLFTNFREFLARAGQATPLVIFLDDLQWADESTLQLTQHLAPQLASLPILVVAAYREVGIAMTPAAAKSRLHGLLDRVRGQSRGPHPTRDQGGARSARRTASRPFDRTAAIRPVRRADPAHRARHGQPSGEGRAGIRRSHRRESVLRRRAFPAPEGRRPSVRCARPLDARARSRRGGGPRLRADRPGPQDAARLARYADRAESGGRDRPALRPGPPRTGGRDRR